MNKQTFEEKYQEAKSKAQTLDEISDDMTNYEYLKFLKESFPHMDFTFTFTVLMIEAEESCTWRGHSMSWYYVNQYKGIAFAKCNQCGKEVHCYKNPAPNGIDISGEAVALGCED